MKQSLRLLLTGALALFAAFSAHGEVLYQISPYYNALGTGVRPLEAVRRRLPELKELGIDVVYLQPITPSAEPGQGYDTIDHFSVSSNLGTEADLHALIRDAHSLGEKVILDVALNHLSKEHPYVRDVETKGASSKYANFFQSKGDPSQPFNNFLHLIQIGQGHFAYYFWEELLNLNYSSQAVRDYASQVLTYWVRGFDVDGYRLDAAWGPSARWPDFYRVMSQKLRAVRPNVLLLAEESAGYPARYQGTGHPHLQNSGFDLAYDWNSEDPKWVSKWSFEDCYNEKSSAKSAELFVHALRLTQGAKVGVLRFIQNNDTASFNFTHDESLTHFATAIEFLLPGSPLLSYGQEVGARYKQWELPAFDSKRTMKSYAPSEWAFHQSLIRWRKSSKALQEGALEILPITTPGIVRLIRRTLSESVTIELDFTRHAITVNGKPLSLS